MANGCSRQTIIVLIWLVALGILLALGYRINRPDGPARAAQLPQETSCLSDNGQIAGTDDGRIYQVPDGPLLRQVDVKGSCILSPNGRWYVIDQSLPTSNDGQRRIWIVRTDDQTPAWSIPRPPGIGTGIVNNSGSFLAIIQAGTDHALAIYNLHTGTANVLPTPITGVSTLQFSTDDRFLLVSTDNSILMLNSGTWTIDNRIDFAHNEWTYDTRTRHLFMAHDSQLHVVTMNAYPPILRAELPYPFDGSLQSIHLSPDSQYLVVNSIYLSSNGIVVGLPVLRSPPREMALLRLADGKIVQRFAVPSGEMISPTFTPDGQWIMTLGPTAGVTLWRVAPHSLQEERLHQLPALGAWLIGIGGVLICVWRAVSGRWLLRA